VISLFDEKQLVAAHLEKVAERRSQPEAPRAPPVPLLEPGGKDLDGLLLAPDDHRPGDLVGLAAGVEPHADPRPVCHPT